MKNLVNIRLAFMITAALCITEYADAQNLSGVKKSLNQYMQTSLQEKLYVHTDRGTYLTGEILWFKIYDVDDKTNTPLDFSKIAYLDIIDNNHNTILQCKVALSNATGSGSVYIPVSVNNGNYKLRVYTSWMKNFSPDFYFEKAIAIINPVKSGKEATDTLPDYDTQLFPEGGNLVINLQSKVGFKVADRNGKGVLCRGAIVDQRNDTVVKFRPLKFGMGSFIFTPAAGNTYRAVFIMPDGRQIGKTLPAINNEGYVMRLNPGNDTYNVEVKGSAANRLATVSLLVHTRGAAKITQEKTLQNGSASFSIDKAKLGDGISTVTFFSAAMQPVCERLVFKYPEKKLLINATADQPQYGTREKVQVKLDTRDQSQNSISGDLSVAVYKIDSLQGYDENDILSYLWLRSDLKGNIESPGYYFAGNDAETALALDNLLITQGWRRFSWSDVMTGKPYANYDFLPEYYGPIITAQLKSNTTNAERAGIFGFLSIPGKNIQFYNTTSNYTGRFYFNAKPFYGAGEIITQTNYNTADSVYHVEVESPFSAKYGTSLLPPFNPDKNMQAALRSRSIGMQAQNIFTANNLKRFFEPVVDSIPFYGTPDKSYMLDNYTRFPTMEEILREYVTWVLTSKSRGKFRMAIHNEDNMLKDEPLVLLDGVPVFDIDRAYSIDPLKLTRIDVIHNRYFYGPYTAEGIVSMTSYKGNLAGFELNPKTTIVDYDGLSLRREFYSPAYETQQQINNRVPDFRNLLYWTPKVITGKQGSGSLTFYTSDQQGKYIGVVQGIAGDGGAGSRYFNFEVHR